MCLTMVTKLNGVGRFVSLTNSRLQQTQTETEKETEKAELNQVLKGLQT